MVSGFEEIMDSETDFSRRSIPELILYLKSSFRDADFKAVESLLLTRESKLKSEIEKKEHDNELCKEILAFKVARENKLMSNTQSIMKEKELLKYEYEGERLKRIDLENELQKCRAEALELGDRNSRMSEELKQCRGRENILKREKCVLESAKRRLETEVEMSNRRIVNLEKDASELMKLDNFEHVVPINAVVTDEMKRQKEEIPENMKVLTDANGLDVKIEASSINCDDDINLESAAVANSGNLRPPSHAIVEIIDSDDDCDARRSLISKDSAFDRAHSGQTGTGNGTRILKRKQPSSPSVGENEGGRDRDHNDNVDNSVLIGKREMPEAAVPICRPFDSLVNNFSAIASTPFDSNRDEKVSSHETRRQCGEKRRADTFQNFINSLPLLPRGFLDRLECSSSNSSSSSSSSFSSSSSDSDDN